MKQLLLSILSIFLIASTSCGQAKKNRTTEKYPQAKSASEWKKVMSPITYHVMVNSGTETPYKNPYFDNHQKGVYVSAATGQVLFSSDDKFDSGTGWPSFTRPINSKSVKIITDTSYGMLRQEVVEASTGLHLGHVFNDGPADRGGKRYCMNSAALKFIKK